MSNRVVVQNPAHTVTVNGDTSAVTISNAGVVIGPVGNQGVPGPKGDKGDSIVGPKGDKGDAGALLVDTSVGYLHGTGSAVEVIPKVPYTDVSGLTPYNLYVYTKAEVDALIAGITAGPAGGATVYSEPVVTGGAGSELLFDDNGDIIMTFIPISA